MAVNSGNGWVKFNLSTQVLQWNTGVANVYTSDPVDAGVPLEDGSEALTAITVVEGDAVGDDTAYWTFGEGPVECVLITAESETVYVGSPFFKVEGAIVNVHPTQDQVESGRVGDGIDHSDYLTATNLVTVESPPWVVAPILPDEITGAQGTDDTAILVLLLTALDGLGLITDSTTGE